MAILAIFIDDFACSALWGTPDPAETMDAATVRPRILLSSQVLLREQADQDMPDQAIVTGLAEDARTLAKRAGWAVGRNVSFQTIGLKEALESETILPAYLLALIAGCLNIAGPDRAIERVNMAITLRPIDGVGAMDRVKQAEATVNAALGGKATVKFVGEALDLALRGGARDNPSLIEREKIHGAVGLWRDGLTAQLATVTNEGELDQRRPAGSAPALLAPKDFFAGTKGDVVLRSVVEVASGGLGEIEGVEVNASLFADDSDLLKAFRKQFEETPTMNAVRVILTGAIFLDCRVCRALAPKPGELLLRCLGKDGAGTKESRNPECPNRHKPLLGVGLVLRQLLVEKPDNRKGKSDSEWSESGAVTQCRLKKDGKGSLSISDFLPEHGGKESLRVEGQPTDGDKTSVIEARRCDDGSWKLAAHLEGRLLRLNLLEANESKLKLESDGRYLLTPDEAKRTNLRALQHLAREGLILYHPNSNPLLLHRHE